MNKGQNAGTPLQRKVSSLDLTMTTKETPVRSAHTLDVLLKDGDGTRYQVTQPSTRLTKKVFCIGLNRSNYRGINYRLISGTLGLCLTGVKRESKVKCNTYHYVNVGSMMVGLYEDWANCG